MRGRAAGSGLDRRLFLETTMAAVNAPLFAALATPLMLYTVGFAARVRLLRNRAERERRQAQDAARAKALRITQTVEEIKHLALATPLPVAKAVTADRRETISRRA